MVDPFETETVQAQIELAADYLTTRVRQDFVDTMVPWDNDPPFESPIEVVFWVWWHAIWRGDGDCTYDYELNPQRTVTAGDATYRLDFAVQLADPDLYAAESQIGPFPQIAIELDGHDWHERTRDQVILRNQRDRDLQTAGWKVFHFSGTETLRNPRRCIQIVRDFIDEVAGEWFIALRRHTAHRIG